MKHRRQQYLEFKEYRYYIFCEGEQTELQYFAGFKRLIEDNPIYKDMVLIEIEPCAAETMRVIEMAEKYVEDHNIQKGQIWCVILADVRNREDLRWSSIWENMCLIEMRLWQFLACESTPNCHIS